jgi:predicted NBD/HSP70 family sugar kinase
MYVLLDIGGTKTRIALSHDGRSFENPVIIDSIEDFEEGINTIRAKVEELAPGEQVEKVVVGVAGPLNEDDSVLMQANLSEWAGKPLKRSLEDAFGGAEVILENDTALVGLGEMVAGAGSVEGIGVYVTVSTSVGASLFVNGEIQPTHFGVEAGHMMVSLENDSSQGEHAGHLDGYISGRSFEKKYKMKPYEVTDPKVWDETARILALGLYNMSVHWSPDFFVLGGRMIIGDPAIPLDATEKYLKEILTIFPETPEVRRASLGDIGGLHGALALLQKSL